jgi:uncharacterized protein YecE (DUF72 family)
MHAMGNLFIGTSGYVYKHWRGVFCPNDLPQDEWLAFYRRQFSTVEINATFYGNFSRETFAKWRQEAGNDFAFTLKGTRYITHIKRLRDAKPSIERFFTPAAGLGRGLSCVCWQFPRNFQCKDETLARLETFLSLLPHDARQAFEFRHDSWFNETVFALLDRHQAGFVINDSPHFAATENITGGFAYIRFHGPGKLYASSHSKAELTAWAKRIERFRERYDVYAYFNNDAAAYAVKNAAELRSLIAEMRYA